MGNKINIYPTKCNLCGGKVIYTQNDTIYGKRYGSGYCYLCTKCGAYVGTHKPRPKEALGLLADDRMRKGKMACHEKFDSFWKGKKNAKRKRAALYENLAEEMGIEVTNCHFGYFTLDELKKAYRIIRGWKNLTE